MREFKYFARYFSRIAKNYLSIIYLLFSIFYGNKIIFLISWSIFWRYSIIHWKTEDDETAARNAKVKYYMRRNVHYCVRLFVRRFQERAFDFMLVVENWILENPSIQIKNINSNKTKLITIPKSNLKSNSVENFLRVLVKNEIITTYIYISSVNSND